jgi:F-type H+-transporting ATPase subunit delta
MSITSLQYASALYDALKGVSDKGAVMREFASILSDRGETGKVSEIERVYEMIRQRNEHESVVHITSGQEVGGHIFPKDLGGKKVREEQRVDTSLIGGVRVRINDTLVDTSIARRLKELTDALT